MMRSTTSQKKGHKFRGFLKLCFKVTFETTPYIILSPEGVLYKFRLHLCQRPAYKIIVQNINNK